MKHLIEVIIGLLVLGVTLYLLGKYNPLHLLTWLTAIIGTVVGTAALFYADVNWGRFLDQTL